MKLLRITDMLKTARSLSGWHFHMLGKGCVFNSHQGKYIILLETGKESLYALFDKKPLSGAKQLADLMYGFLEDPKTKKIMAASYNHRPKSDLAAIEKLFYRELE